MKSVGAVGKPDITQAGARRKVLCSRTETGQPPGRTWASGQAQHRDGGSTWHINTPEYIGKRPRQLGMTRCIHIQLQYRYK